MIASLPMYDWAEIKPVTDRLWTGIRDRLRAAGIEAPNELTRGIDMWDSWHDPDLLVSQTCGFPYRTKLHDKVTLVGTPDFALPDINGQPHRLSDYRGKKVFLATWASW